LTSVVRAPLAINLGSTIEVVRAPHRREEPPVPAESILAVSAATWGIAMGLSPALQIRQMLQTRSSRDVSVGYFTVLNVGFVLWASYGISLPNAAVVIPNFVAFAVGSATIAVALRLRAEERRRVPVSQPTAAEESERQIDHSPG
jgi:MtN3 and saliva related transmembrane protein